MGYYIYQRESTLRIKAENTEKAKEILSKYWEEDDNYIVLCEDMRSLCKKGDLQKILWYMEFGVDVDEEGNLHNFDYTGEKAGWEDAVLGLLAPVIEPNSYIEFVGEEGEHFRYCFDGEKMTEEDSDVVYPSDPKYVIVAQMPNAAANEPPVICDVLYQKTDADRKMHLLAEQFMAKLDAKKYEQEYDENSWCAYHAGHKDQPYIKLSICQTSSSLCI